MSAEDSITMAFRLAVKDLTVELRRPHELLSIIAFTLSSVIVSSFAWRDILNPEPVVVSAAMWVIVYFASILALTTSFAREVDRGTIDGLRSLPCPSHSVLVGKMIYGCVTLIIVLGSLICSSFIFLNLELSVVPLLLIVFSLGVVDLALMGSIMSAVLMYSEGKNLLLAFLFFPVSVPILLPGIQAASKIIAGSPFWDIIPEMRLLIAFMLGVLAVSLLLFKELFIE
jgi:heme exporter protein B